jgi:lysophospholipase L1-like esterase
MRIRLLASLGTVLLFLLGTVPAQADGGDHGGRQSYLALGDSVAFGFNPLVKNPKDVDTFVGYPEIVARNLGLKDVNAACSGEATGGFIDAHGLDNSCRAYRAAFPLHVSYQGTQLAFAIKYLKAHPQTRLVTLNLDANDFFRLSSGPSTDFWPPSTCFTPNLVQYFTTCAVQNLETIFAAIKATGYKGLIVALTYYALDYSDPNGLALSGLLNGAMSAAATASGVLIASGFTAWQPFTAAFSGSSCNAGLLIRTSPTGCDIHPTPRGRDLLARAITKTIANSCAEHDAQDCLEANHDD